MNKNYDQESREIEMEDDKFLCELCNREMIGREVQRSFQDGFCDNCRESSESE